MNLFRFGTSGNEMPGVILGDKRIDVSSFGGDYDEHFFATKGLRRLGCWLKEKCRPMSKSDSSVRLGPCVQRPSKIICNGLTMHSTQLSRGWKSPMNQWSFSKRHPPYADRMMTWSFQGTQQWTDWEVGLAIIVETQAAYVSADRTMDCIAGYCLFNDYSEREFQLERGGQWVKGKSFDTFPPLGPFHATPDEIRDPHSLHLWLKVNGQIMQDSNTSDLIFRIPFLVSYLSQFMTLLPGDVISTSTPQGVGFGLSPPKYLRDGDIVERGISGLGSATQRVVAYEKFQVKRSLTQRSDFLGSVDICMGLSGRSS